MELNLRKPLVVLDLETTGVSIASDRIVEFSALKVSPGGAEEWLSMRLNPGIPISPEATRVHGITDADVANEPHFRDVARRIAAFLEGCDLAGFNSMKFDIPILCEEFLRVNVDFNPARHRYVDVQVIFHKKEQRTLSAAYKFYCDKELENAHSSKADAAATYEILKAQLDRYPDLENDIGKLSSYSAFNNNADLAGRIIFNEQGQEVFNFGKHRGKPVEQVFREEPSYYSWMMNGDFPLNTKQVITAIKVRSFGKA
ncbi:MAG TPA: 3'-5' exonuclease [Bacteroidales bacterium]|jgi:DNA polymerase-3 subunit epsilon|nr:3'-5' exonuclease [Bacteroidales bacterium]MDI9533624.1 3'-5' exonuclease [Bacteroidota bacterium]OPZ57127.1 MAG: DNA polymerase III PolC-type [Bacteroidetes bacterium ADurb.BinA012]MBK7733581.1 3'-5' exonuclease [Bacteroidales bacterium]MBP7037199.1 3'-5' exonuclease [Bacteroidales bacterium]